MKPEVTVLKRAGEVKVQLKNNGKKVADLGTAKSFKAAKNRALKLIDQIRKQLEKLDE